MGFGAPSGACYRRGCGRGLAGHGDDAHQIFAQGVGVDLLELFADIAHEAGELFIRGQGDDNEAGADLACVEVDGADSPRGGQHIEHSGADRGGAGVAGLELVHAARQLRGQARLVDLEMLDDSREVAGG
jgi:hypothetical protein